MIFEEGYNYEQEINYDLRSDVFVYFLLYEEDVVYVGQTTAGIQRPLNHIKDKNFNKIKIIYCSIEELGELEQKFIIKYNPIYNKAKHLMQRNRDINTIYKTVEKEVIVEVELKNDKNINRKEFCEWFSISDNMLKKWINKGIIPYMIIDGEYVFNKRRVLDFLEKKRGE